MIGKIYGLLHINYQAIIWTNIDIMSMGPTGTNFSEILIKTQNFSFKKMALKVPSEKCQPFC